MRRLIERIKVAWDLLLGRPVPFKVKRIGADESGATLQTWYFDFNRRGQVFLIILAQDKIREEKRKLNIQAHAESIHGDPAAVLLKGARADMLRTPADVRDPESKTIQEALNLPDHGPCLDYVPHDGLTEKQKEDRLIEDWRKRQE
jgi:hypothetical protein